MNVFEIPAQICIVPKRYCSCGKKLSLWNMEIACFTCSEKGLGVRVSQSAEAKGKGYKLGRIGRAQPKDGRLCKRCFKSPRNPKSRCHCDKCLDYHRAWARDKGAKGGQGRPPIPRGIA